MFDVGDVMSVDIPFMDKIGSKVRPALVLFEELGNAAIAIITSNTSMKGVSLSRDDGSKRDSVIKLNHITTVPRGMVGKKLFRLEKEKRRRVYEGLLARLSPMSF